jgi:uncharacterized ion transporter superfamily protein YfcC
MEQKAGAQISQKSFIQSFVILFILMIAAGVLTRVVPAGTFTRSLVDGRQTIDPNSFTYSVRPDYPVWRWFTAPVEVLGGSDGLTVITIILFLLMVGASFAVLDKSGILRAVIARIVGRFGQRKYLLLMMISLFFMAMGAFFGIFEETLPMVPIMIALSIYLGWDTFVGLGMSILAVNMGFSAAVTNPFTIGVAQKLANLPLFSGAWLRLIFFVVTYAVFMLFLVGYAKKIEKKPELSPCYNEDKAAGEKYRALNLDADIHQAEIRKSLLWFGGFVVLIMLVLVGSPFIDFISSYSLPIVSLLFLAAGLGAGFLSGAKGKTVWSAAWEGIMGIAPGIVLILMAASIKFIVATGGIMDTILYQASSSMSHASPFAAALLVYGLALLIEFFIGSGSAKAFLLMPILLPLADIVGVTRQTAVMAYCFGDGFSNLIYPTNPVLLIALGLTVVTYPKWLKWSLKLWAYIVPLSILFIGLAVWLHFGPF